MRFVLWQKQPFGTGRRIWHARVLTLHVGLSVHDVLIISAQVINVSGHRIGTAEVESALVRACNSHPSEAR